MHAAVRVVGVTPRVIDVGPPVREEDLATRTHALIRARHQCPVYSRATPFANALAATVTSAMSGRPQHRSGTSSYRKPLV